MGPHKKYNSNGSILKYEVQLLAWKFFQEPRIDYHETFCHVIKLSSLVILFSFLQPWILKFIRWMSIWLFQNGILHEKIFMQHPKDYIQQGAKNKTCHLLHKLYNLKQFLQIWYEHLWIKKKRFDFTKSKVKQMIWNLTKVWHQLLSMM
jgi:hypothetical protein